VRRCQKVPPFVIEPVPVCAKMGLTLAEAEPISGGRSTSVITYLRKGKNTAQQLEERGVRICDRINFADAEVSEEGRGGSAPVPGAEVTLQPLVKTTVMWIVLLQPMEVQGGTDIHLQPVEDPTPEQVDVSRRRLQLVEILHRSRVLSGPVTLQGTHAGAVCS